ncbi:AAA family ATPase [Luminiphilus sp.]|nr:AAA family ATPase [Luminiphilus sp.]
MIVNSIQLKNFQCYAGEASQNEFRFTRGLNLIIGDNGSGKSKLWDAFYWVLYDQIFQSDDYAFYTTSQYQENLISDKAKSECAVGDSVDAQVILIAQNSAGLKYRVTRMYRAKKLDGGKWAPEKESLLTIDKWGTTRWDLCAQDKHPSIINQIVHPDLKEYMWFQGENIKDLMDLRDKTSLTKVINTLSDIDNYDKILEAVIRGSQQATGAFDKAKIKNSRDEQRSRQLENDLRHAREQLRNAEDSIDNSKLERDGALSRRDNLLSKFQDAELRRDTQNKVAKLEAKIEILGAQLKDKTEDFSKNLINSQWVLQNAVGALAEFDQKFSAFNTQVIEHKERFKPDEPKLPVDVPAPVHVDNMLRAGECFVCGREAKEGSEPHNHMKRLLSRYEEEQPEYFANDNYPFFNRLYNNRVENKLLVNNIDQDIARSLEEIESLKEQVAYARDEKAGIENQIGGLVSGLENAGDIINEFNMHQKKLEDAQKDIRISEENASNLRFKIGQYDSELAKLSQSEETSREEIVDSVWKFLARSAKEARQRVFDDIVNELEGAANEIFRQMAAANNSITGRVKIETTSSNTCVSKIVDSSGELMRGSNESNIQLVKLSLIMAILGSKQQWSRNYALIADGPTSHMAENYSDGFYAALSENFEQSIVVTKDFLSTESLRRLSKLRVGNVFRITSSHGSEQREDRFDLEVKAEKVSLYD